ncbi:STAS domain-containing protein [Peptoniphilaceae bacterium SGI.131]
MSFAIKFEENENLRVFLSGDLDINTVDEFRKEVLEKYDDKDLDIIFDLNDLEYIDSTGLGAIIAVYKKVKEKGKNLTVVNAKKNIKKLFFITELDKIFNMED